MLMDEAELRLWLLKQIERYGTQANFCRCMDIAPQNIGEVLKGKRPVPKRLLRSLRIERVVRYRVKDRVGP